MVLQFQGSWAVFLRRSIFQINCWLRMM